MMKPRRYENETYRHNRRIIEHLQKVSGKQGFTKFITISFVYSKHATPLWKHDVLLISKLIGAYFNTVSQRLNGRPRKHDNEERPKVPSIGVPEYRDKNGNGTFLHYHCLLKIPESKSLYFHEITKKFWNKVVRNNIGYPPKVQIRAAYRPSGATFYNNKNIDADVTIQYSIFHGIQV